MYSAKPSKLTCHCGGSLREGVCTDCGISHRKQSFQPTSNCQVCGGNKSRKINTEKCVYVQGLAKQYSEKTVNVCFRCYKQLRDRSFHCTLARTKNDFQEMEQEALFYGDNTNKLIRKRVIVNDHELNINPQLWHEIGVYNNQEGIESI